MKYFYVAVFLCMSSAVSSGQEESRESTAKQHPELAILVRNWASKLGGELWQYGKFVTRQTRVKESFKDTTLVIENGETLLQNIHENISQMMKQKVEAVRRIMDQAEQIAQAQKETDIDYNFAFYNAKNLTNSLDNTTDETTKEPDIEARELQDDSFISSSRFPENEGYQQDDPVSSEEPGFKDSDDMVDPDLEDLEHEEKIQAVQKPPIDKSSLPLRRNKHFYDIPVDLNHSAVHVPSNVYERSKEVIAGIKWSEELDKIFQSNYNEDPSLSWQYFGSSTGFMRQYPAMIWSQEPIDLFDCRTRSWYIEAGSSPKDVVILVDKSGSMTGMRREIARHVVHNILDTLGNNDYVNIYTFSNTTDPLVDCFDNQLVQANLANVRVFKESMNDFKTEQIANFSLALVTAFELLEEYRNQSKGANCNQAIMLITDGVQYNYKEIFEKYNWNNLPYMNVRVFTYLIGREVSDVREVKWMACANRGYYVHLSTYAEVREEVLHYIPVMARPMVLHTNRKPNPAWSPVYADVTDPKLTNWLWVNRERNRQRERFMGYRKLKSMLSGDVMDKTFVHQQKVKQDNYGDTQVYHLMTSVSLPVYDKRPYQERVANLLGVAGTDIPIEHIQRLMLPHRLGVNGYAFIVTNNGYILTHPDLRPVYQGILKPAYNRVDVVEVEILDDDTASRDFSEEIRNFRIALVNQTSGSATFKVKSHLDDMRRIMRLTRNYFYRGISGTPFSLVVALPEKYGFTRIEPKVENDVHRMSLSGEKKPLLRYFNGNWTIHPDWHYCRCSRNEVVFETPEEEFIHFLKRMEKSGWKWTKECDRKLICQIVSDAKFTDWFNENIATSNEEENGPELIKKIGVVVAFVATHSGLTRWQNFPQNIDSSEFDPNFRMLHNKAIDEIWYKRAVEYHFVEPDNFVYSVPHDIGNTSHSLVTVSSAIFKENGTRKAPVAVVGYQFYHSAMQTLFNKITTNCGDIPCKRSCDSGELHCLVLDDSGIVVVSNDPSETGTFFGDIRPDIMEKLVREDIYNVVTMYDYQALCAEPMDSSPAVKVRSPIPHLSNIFQWFLGVLVLSARMVLGNHHFEQYNGPDHHPEHHFEVRDDHVPDRNGERSEEAEMPLSDKEFVQKFAITKTKPEPCDTQMALYSLVHYSERNFSTSAYNKSMEECSRPYIVQKVSRSNMILLVITKICIKEDSQLKSPLPEEVNYNMSLACYRALHNDFPKKYYMSCINSHANESEIKLCGGSTDISPVHIVPTVLLTAVLYFLLIE